MERHGYRVFEDKSQSNGVRSPVGLQQVLSTQQIKRRPMGSYFVLKRLQVREARSVNLPVLSESNYTIEGNLAHSTAFSAMGSHSLDMDPLGCRKYFDKFC